PRSVGPDGKVPNDGVYDPVGIYGASKMLNEIAAREYAAQFGLRSVTLRIPAAFGPGVTQSWVRFIPQMIQAIVEGRPAPMPANRIVMPWLYVENIADAFARALEVTGDPSIRAYTLPGTELGVDRIVALVRAMFPGVPEQAIEWPDPVSLPRFEG